MKNPLRKFFYTRIESWKSGWLIMRNGRGDTLIRLEWSLAGKMTHASISIDPCEDVTLSAGIPGLGLYLSLYSQRLNKFLCRITGITDYGEKRLGLTIFEGFLSWDIWVDPFGSDFNTPKWRDGSFDIPGFLLGQATYSVIRSDRHQVEIPMPEGPHPTTIDMKLEQWKRPRWFPKRVQRAHIEIHKPIVVPGKGESSWDMGDDAINAMTTPARDVAEAIGKVVESAMRDRLRYG